MATTSKNFSSMRAAGSGETDVLAQCVVSFTGTASTPGYCVLNAWRNPTVPGLTYWGPAPVGGAGTNNPGSLVSGLGTLGIASVVRVQTGVYNFILTQAFQALVGVNVTFASASATPGAVPACFDTTLSLYNTNPTGTVGNFSPAIGTASPVALNAACPVRQIQLVFLGSTDVATEPAATDIAFVQFSFRTSNVN